MFLRVFKISGHSMIPLFNPSDRILASSIPYWFSSPKISDVIVFKYNKKCMIKKIVKVEDERFYIEGENKKDSLRIGKIKRQNILGKVIMKI